MEQTIVLAVLCTAMILIICKDIAYLCKIMK